MLLECVASILQNDFQDFEVIVVDQEPGRDLEEVLARRFNADSRLVYLFLDEANLSRARNLGVKHARGHILVFCDDDTEVEKGWLRAYMEAFEACGQVPAVVGGRLDPLWLAPKPDWLPRSKEYLLGIYSKSEGLDLLPGPELPIGANFAVHRKVMDTVGFFDERIGYSYTRKRGMIGGEDSLFSLRARQAHYSLYHHGAARARHKISPYKLSRRYFIRRNFWEGVTLLTVLHLSGSPYAKAWPRVLLWHVREIARWTWSLARTAVRWPRAANPGQDAMEAICSIANSAGVIRAAVKLGFTGRLPW
jgi:glucosyl-dolichyl phosphate glucuronosyltransferase